MDVHMHQTNKNLVASETEKSLFILKKNVKSAIYVIR